jgi:carbonic anhydrase
MISLNNIKNDLLASLVVFLVAIPLCLGIALASGTSVFAGVLSGVIGGIVVGILSESRFSVSGPAAGMAAVVVSSLAQLGSYENFLLALTVAGLLQIAGGLLRAGFIANYIPTVVIKGLLGAIGILIILKQIPLAAGYIPDSLSVQKALQVANGRLDLKDFTYVLEHIKISCVFITCFSLLILGLWDKIPFQPLKLFPATFVVVLSSVSINFLWKKFVPSFYLQGDYLVTIPLSDNFLDIIHHLNYPNFLSWKNPHVYMCGFMIAIVASLETLLNLEGVEKLDKRHGYCSRNRELFAQGVGNTLAGLLGALPITSVIVRSSVNINAGGATKMSTIFHGFLLLMSLSVLDDWLNHIPISALAAILIHTGYKLAKPSLFIEVYHQGARYFLPFIITISAIIVTNLLLGIGIGLGVSLLFILYHHSHNCFTIFHEKRPSGDLQRLRLPQHATFLSRSGIIEGLNQIPNGSKVIIDARFTDYIDEDILGIIQDFKKTLQERNILINLEGFKTAYNIDKQDSFVDVTTYDVQASLGPDKILSMLKEGNQRFVQDIPIHKNYKRELAATSQSQHPLAVVLSCIDSRVPIELIFDLSLGDVFVTRIAGNVSDLDVIASIEFACHVAGAKLILVLGHKNCGAVKAACTHFQGLEKGKPPKVNHHINELLEKIKPALDQEIKKNKKRTKKKFVEDVTRSHVNLTQKEIYKGSEVLRGLIDSGKIKLIGAYYDLETGKVDFTF